MNHPGRIVKRSVAIAGHRTSVSLEEAFWNALKGIAAAEGRSLAALIAQVDAQRGEANLSSALRVFALMQCSPGNCSEGLAETPDAK
jgi:predicted DNA-binding ribbon-helix-helix protein